MNLIILLKIKFKIQIKKKMKICIKVVKKEIHLGVIEFSIKKIVI